MRSIVFIKDFANKVVGDIFNCDGMLASQLVNEDKVAEYCTDDAVVDNSKPKKYKKEKD